MINQMKRAVSFLTAAFVALSLCACGSGGDQELTGDDWRVSGVVAGSGTITHFPYMVAFCSALLFTVWSLGMKDGSSTMQQK